MIRLVSAVAVTALLGAFAVPALATDTDSLSAFLASCSSDAKSCKSFAHDLVASAKSAGYGCIPKSLSADDAGAQLLDWMKGPASANPKYAKMALEDVMWAGVDELWPCRR